MRTIIFALVVLTAAGCGGSTDDLSGLPDGDPRLVQLRTEAPSIEGTITETDRNGRILVEEEPDEPSGSAKAWVQLTEETRVVRPDGTTASRNDLEVGGEVSVWFTGPVAESYPVQAAADMVELENGAGGG